MVLVTFNIFAFVAFLGTVQYRGEITDFFSLDNKTNRSPYFNALISGEKDITFIQRKMKQLPGVESIQIKNKLNASSELNNILPGETISEALGAKTFTPVKIFLNANITKSSRNLIREYLTRLMGKESVTFSRVKYPAKINLKKYPFFKVFSNWSGAYFAFICFGLWIVSIILIAPYFYQQAYIIEKFQRKNAVGIKMYGQLLLVITSIAIISFTVFNAKFSLVSVSLIGGGLISALFAFSLAKVSSRRIL